MENCESFPLVHWVLALEIEANLGNFFAVSVIPSLYAREETVVWYGKSKENDSWRCLADCFRLDVFGVGTDSALWHTVSVI
jgi:hypothetical protein